MIARPIHDNHERRWGFGVHSFVPPSTPVAPIPPDTPFPATEGPNEVVLLASGKMTKTVLGDGRPLAKEGHDTGAGIIHMSDPMHAGMAIAVAFSKYKVMFGAATVRANGDALGVWRDAKLPLLYCSSPMSLFCVGDRNNIDGDSANTVFVGVSPADVAAGVSAIRTEIVLDLIFGKLFKLGGLKEIFKKLPPGYSDWAKQYAKSLAKNLAKGLGGAVTTLGGRPKVRVEIPVVGVGVEATRDGIKIGPPGEPGQYLDTSKDEGQPSEPLSNHAE